MKCLQKIIINMLELIFCLTLMSVSIASAHVGEKCPLVILFRLCMATNAYCDNNNICQCKPDYPVKVDPHTCRKARRYGDRCTVTAECNYTDKNSYCTQLSYRSVCECHDGFRYDSNEDLCAKADEMTSSGPNLFLPTAVGLSLALCCLVCCCLASLHFCRTRRRRRRTRASATPRNNSPRRGARNTRLPSIPSTPEDIGTLPPYDVAVTLQPMKDQYIPEDDELPPSYEDVMKNGELSKPSTPT